MSLTSEKVTSEYITKIGFGRHRIEVETTVPNVADGVRSMFRFMPDSPDQQTASSIRVTEVGDQRYRITGVLPPTKAVSTRAIAEVRLRVIQAFADARRDLVWMHAGAACRDQKAILAVGPWGSGKSTLIRALCESGYEYLSDDITPIDVDSGRAFAFPVGPSNRTSEDVLPRDDVARLKKDSWQPESVFSSPEGAALVRLVLPAYSPTEAYRLGPSSPADAAARLLEQCFGLTRDADRAVGRITQLAARMQPVSLVFSNPEQAREAASALTVTGG